MCKKWQTDERNVLNATWDISNNVNTPLTFSDSPLLTPLHHHWMIPGKLFSGAQKTRFVDDSGRDPGLSQTCLIHELHLKEARMTTGL
ncbi:MAG: hypothetical protein CL912_14505 [Deltaproteobacteria bacterium]|nr:hypothetical protein [Deltaproteobacteria bacterium]